jgi:hypothetical protein
MIPDGKKGVKQKGIQKRNIPLLYPFFQSFGFSVISFLQLQNICQNTTTGIG